MKHPLRTFKNEEFWAVFKKTRAFTLIEMLVVVAIIAILAAILLPTLAKAKVRGYTAACINNEKQLIQAWLLYSGDSADALAHNGTTVEGGDPNNKLWVQGVFFYPKDNTNYSLLLDPKYAQFAPYIRTIKTYLCPADRRTVQVSGVTYAKLRSYAMNAYVGWRNTMDSRLSSNYLFYRKTTQMIRPGAPNLFIFQDVHPDSICWPFFGTYMDPSPDRFFNFPASHHGRGGVIAFGDGHVSQHRWLDDRTVKALSPDYHKHNDASPGNQDVVWLRTHASAAK